MNDADVFLAIDHGIATVTLNRPAVLNALNRELGIALHETLRDISDNRDVRCVVLTGAGDHFMAGGDIAWFRDNLETIRGSRGEELHGLFEHVHGTVQTLRNMPQPVIARVHGACAGFGLSLMMACDLAVAAEGSVFTLAYRHIGTSPDGSSTYFLPRLVGARVAAELTLLGERFDAARALSLGLVNRVVPADALDAAVADMAAPLVDAPAEALARSKRLLNDTWSRDLAAQLEAEKQAFIASAQTDDFAEGVNAFCEKRKPDFA